MDEVLCLQNVGKRYGAQRAVEGVGFSLHRGEILGLLGVNGAGKTTTMRMIAGLIEPSEGSISLLGKPVRPGCGAQYRALGYMPEAVPLYADLTVREQLRFVCGARRAAPDAWECAAAVTELEPMLSRLIGHLSKGYRQRVGLAQALIGNPPLLLLDEPASGLDPRQAAGLRTLLETLAAGGTAVLVSSHILSQMGAVATRLVVLHHGRMVADTTPAALTGSENRLVLTVEQVTPALLDALAALPHLQVLSRQEGTLLLKSDAGQDLRAEVSQTVTRCGCVLLELRRDTHTLEDAFLQLIS